MRKRNLVVLTAMLAALAVLLIIPAVGPGIHVSADGSLVTVGPGAGLIAHPVLLAAGRDDPPPRRGRDDPPPHG